MRSKLPAAFLAAAKTLLGPKGWSQAPDKLAPCLQEWRGRWHGHTQLLALPDNSQTVAKLVELCARHQVAITPQGGNTGLVGGQIPQGELLLSTQKLNQICTVDKASMSLTASAGITLQQAANAARQAGLLFALDLASGGSATIGGAISTNAGGMGVLRYGNMREQVLGLEVVGASGQIWDGLSALRKDNTGYDLKQVFIGAEGTLGIVTAASLRLFARPKARLVAWCALDSAKNALALLGLLREQSGDQICKFELVSSFALSLALKQMPDAHPPLRQSHNWHVLVEFGLHDATSGPEQMNVALEAAMTAGLVQDVVIASSQSQANALHGLRENISAAQKGQGAVIKHDISLPLATIPEFLQTAERAICQHVPHTRICAFGHLGDGNLHYNLLQPVQMQAQAFEDNREDLTQLVYDLVAKRAGSFSAEHGIGIAKKAELHRYKSATERRMMQQIKQALDPDNRMNPRLLF
ncbi:D-2-hydroxyglutarate dehydrogenase [hydrothermal vent metagenome]|uniref:D-2-hydroxyglutarate dehydrogenase n=1 Tax=hydrothermal vent metagenome TaxID=652676 RepID=A0A3B0RK00_9ZZZZ